MKEQRKEREKGIAEEVIFSPAEKSIYLPNVPTTLHSIYQGLEVLSSCEKGHINFKVSEKKFVSLIAAHKQLLHCAK